MTLSRAQIERFAEVVDRAASDAAPIPMLTLEAPEMTLEDAYTIQRASMALRYGRGERLVGMKMGLTSVAKMKQMGVHNPIYGHLTDAMTIEHGGAMKVGARCHPRTEPEIAFILGKDLEGPVTPEEALEAVESVCAALEIIDSRYRDFKFTLIDVVADNASSTGYVLGPERVPVAGLDLGNLAMRLEIDGEVVEEGNSRAIYDHPVRSLAAQVNMLAERGEKLLAGQVVLSGAATGAVWVKPGNSVRVVVEGVGEARFEAVD